jgi:beta-ureidopropionase
MREVKLATVQFETTKDIELNRKKAIAFCESAAKKGAQAVCFPEFWLTSTPTVGKFERLIPLAESVPGPTFDLFCKKAKELKIFIVPGSLLEKGEDGFYYNTSGLIGPDGTLIARLRKDHPENDFGKAEVDFGIRPGPGEYPVFDTEIGKVAVPIDMDMASVEAPRIMGLKGVEILFWPVCWGANVHESIRIYGLAGSCVSDAFVVVSNRYSWGGDFDVRLIGGSGVIWLRNYIAYVPDYREGIAVTTVDLDYVKTRREECRHRYPYWRRPHTYAQLLDTEMEKKIRGSTK